jgi:hypothetical protein
MKLLTALFSSILTVCAFADQSPRDYEPMYEPLNPVAPYRYEKPTPDYDSRHNWTLRCYTIPGEVDEFGRLKIFCDIIYTPRAPYD